MKWYEQIIMCAVIALIMALIAYIDDREERSKKQKEQAILDYYQDTETLLDSLCIYENDTIFNTNVGNRYLESKHKFDSLYINNND